MKIFKILLASLLIISLNSCNILESQDVSAISGYTIKSGQSFGFCIGKCYSEITINGQNVELLIKERVIVENINTHENWQDYLDLTQKANLHACWSQPIISSQNEVLGTFAIYNNVIKAPNIFMLNLIETYANVAAKAIEKNKYTQIIQKNTKELEEKTLLLENILDTIPDMVWLKDKNGVYLRCNSGFEKFINKKESEIIGKTDYDFLDRESANACIVNDKITSLSFIKYIVVITIIYFVCYIGRYVVEKFYITGSFCEKYSFKTESRTLQTYLIIFSG